MWKVFAQSQQQDFEKTPVVFENVKFSRATVLRKKTVEFKVMISDISGAFEIKESGAVICTGTVRPPTDCENLSVSEIDIPMNTDEDTIKETVLVSNEIYKRLRLMKYEYSGAFLGIKSCSITGTTV